MRQPINFVISCGPKLGAGHLNRCLCLAKALEEKGAMTQFWLSEPAWCDRVPDSRPIPPIWTHPMACVIMDGIAFTQQDLRNTRNVSGLFIVIDDLGDRDIFADLVINPNLFAPRLDYPHISSQNQLIGPEYTLIRPEFVHARQASTPEPRALITFGGGETALLSLDVARELAGLFTGPIDVALGRFGHTLPQNLPGHVHLYLEADMPALMGPATLYVGSLGTSYLEAIAAGLPAVVSAIVDNQEPVMDIAADMGSQVIFPFNAQKIAEVAARALAQTLPLTPAKQPDGQGIYRIADRIACMMG